MSVVMPFVLVRTVDRSHPMVTPLGLRVGFTLSLLLGVFYWSRGLRVDGSIATSGLEMQLLLAATHGLGVVILAIVLFMLGMALGSLLEHRYGEREGG